MHAGREGTTPVPVTMQDGSVIKIWPVLGFVEGDIPWLEKLTNSIGHGGKHSCYRCALNGIWHFRANTVRYVCTHLNEMTLPCKSDLSVTNNFSAVVTMPAVSAKHGPHAQLLPHAQSL